MTVSLWDGHFDPEELAIKPVSIYSSFSYLCSRECKGYYPVVRYLKQYTVVHQGKMNIGAPEIP